MQRQKAKENSLLNDRSHHPREIMKLLISLVTAVSLGLTCTVLGGGNYSALAEQGYRWVLLNGPYACKTEQDVERITTRHTDETELQVVESIECYYLIPGTIVQVIREDPARGMSEMRLGGITRSLWTYSRFLSKRPVTDTYGVIETPENSGLTPTADTAIVPEFPSDSSTSRSGPNTSP
jgi:hypothetical protein